MAWFKGDDKSHNNRKLLAVGLLGTGLHFRAISWCSGEETDGLIPAAVVPSLSPELSGKARTSLLAQMVDQGLWRPHVNGDKRTVVAYEINDYLEFNPSHDHLETKRQTEKDRLAARRNGKH